MIVAAIQLSSGADVKANFEAVDASLAAAAAAGARLALLPENFSFMSADDAAKRAVAEPLESSRIIALLASMAERHGLYLIGGSVTLTSDERPGLLRNASPAFAPDGSFTAIYDKMHLFDVDLESESYRESAVVAPGHAPVSAECGDWSVGLSICYDLRFPELFRYYARIGCQLLAVPAAFTVPTGQAHWKTLLTARAVENQCYVIAAAQCGEHPGGRRTYGHSMIIDPWGRVLAEGGEEPGIITAEIDLAGIKEVRRRLPALEHRRI